MKGKLFCYTLIIFFLALGFLPSVQAGSAVTLPESGMTYSNTILCDATKTIDDKTPFEQLLFTWYFDGTADPEHTNVAGTAGAYFEKTFDTAGPHSISVVVDDRE